MTASAQPEAARADSDTVPDEFVFRLRGRWVAATYAQMMDWISGGAEPTRRVHVETAGGRIDVHTEQ